MDLWIWILLGAAIVILLIVIFTTMRAIRPKAPEPLGAAPSLPPTAAAARRTAAAGAVHPTTPAALSPAVVAQIDALVAAQQKIHAIKVLREATGSSLAEAKSRIDAWVPTTRGAAVAPPMGRSSASHPADAVAHLDPRVRAEIGRLVAAGQKIAAIKLLREATGLGLKDSKAAIESWH